MTEKRFIGRYAGKTTKRLIGIEDIETNRVYITIGESIRLLNELSEENEQLKSDVERQRDLKNTAIRQANWLNEQLEKEEKENEQLKKELSDIDGQLLMLDNCDNWDYDRMKHTVREIAEIIGYNGTINPKR